MANVVNGASRLFFGTGKDGAISDTASLTRSGILECTTYTLGSSATLTPTNTSEGAIAIFATKSITINGQINFGSVQQIAPFGSQGVDSFSSTGASGGAVPSLFSQLLRYYSPFDNKQSFGLGGSIGGAGANGGGSNGGGGGGGGGPRAGGNGGNGSGTPSAGTGGAINFNGCGGYVLLVAPLIVLGSSSVISANGGPGNDASGTGGGGSGGNSGGYVGIVYQSLTDNGGVLAAAGGAGGKGGGGISGGAGGVAGQPGNSGSNGTNAGGSGGGGAGGTIVKMRIV